MEFVNKVESRVANWYSNVPHLPLGVRQWLGANVWWIVLVGVILGALGVVNLFVFGALAALLVAGVGGPIGVALAGAALLVAILVFASTLLLLVITAFAIKPLKEKQKKGWSLMLLALIVAVGFAALTFLFSFDLSSLIMSLLWTAVSGYFLFEIRDQFAAIVPTKSTAKASKAAVSAATKKK